MRRAQLGRGAGARGLLAGGLIGGTNSQLLHTSQDGVTWTSRTTVGNTDQIYSLAYSPLLGRYVAASTINSWYSDDSINWTLAPFPSNRGITNGIAWSPTLNLFVAAHGSPNMNLYSSPDGITWTARPTAYNFQYQSCTWVTALGLFLVGVVGAASILTSPDGINWTVRASQAGYIYGIAHSPVVGRAIACSAAQFISTSTNGTVWTVGNKWLTRNVEPTAVYFSAITGLFMVGGLDGSYATSPDGITWTERTIGFGSQSVECFIDWPEKSLVVAAGSANVVRSSPDGINWTAIPSSLHANTTFRQLLPVI